MVVIEQNDVVGTSVDFENPEAEEGGTIVVSRVDSLGVSEVDKGVVLELFSVPVVEVSDVTVVRVVNLLRLLRGLV